MKTMRSRIGFFCLIVLAAIILSATSAAHADGPGYNLDWWTVDNGASTSSAGGGYTLSGTIGQPDAAVWSSGVGNSYTLAGGFWGGGAPSYKVCLPLLNR